MSVFAQGSGPSREQSGAHRGHADCSEVLLRVFEYIDKEMTPEECERVRAHLDDCGECMSAYERDVLLKALIRRSCQGEAAPQALRMSIMTRITSVRVERTER
ncbi:mycothiol system anti-sigma-R factor [Austwickia chelonae]|uniref:mycothiol system anti-sigma-R factor n=1 Tax=Austwickia chelonae TaxID=100225 RepID=UPI000E25C316|nr:mycothiol system anti-sigma-R factor [Austwickia chelonae]